MKTYVVKEKTGELISFSSDEDARKHIGNRKYDSKLIDYGIEYWEYAITYEIIGDL